MCACWEETGLGCQFDEACRSRLVSGAKGELTATLEDFGDNHVLLRVSRCRISVGDAENDAAPLRPP